VTALAVFDVRRRVLSCTTAQMWLPCGTGNIPHNELPSCASLVTFFTVIMQVQLAERVNRDANVVQVYGAAVAEDAVLLVMELMQARAPDAVLIDSRSRCLSDAN
jgi:hypothetical protein